MLSMKEYLRLKHGDQDIVLHKADFLSQKGYTLIPNYVLLTETLSPYAKLIYAVILSYAWGNKNSAFPGQDKLAADCRVSVATIKRGLQELVKGGFITVIRRGMNRTNVYVLHFKRKG